MHDEQPVGLIGLGLMGAALADRLLTANRLVVGHDIDSARCELVRRAGGRIASGPAEVSSLCGRILLSLPTTETVELVLAQMEGTLTPPKILIDTTTGDPDRVAALGERLASRGIDYVDATVSGSSAETARGEVIVLAGGTKAILDACDDLFQCFSRRWFHLGPWGSGTKMKLVTNLVLGLNRAALAEGLALAAALGLDAKTSLAILSESAAYSLVMDTKGRKMIEKDFAPQGKLSQHLKDVGLLLEQAGRLEIALPLTEVHERLLRQVDSMGLGNADNSAIIQAFGNP